METLQYLDIQDLKNFRVMRIVSLGLQCILCIMLGLLTKQALRLARKMK